MRVHGYSPRFWVRHPISSLHNKYHIFCPFYPKNQGRETFSNESFCTRTKMSRSLVPVSRLGAKPRFWIRREGLLSCSSSTRTTQSCKIPVIFTPITRVSIGYDSSGKSDISTIKTGSYTFSPYTRSRTDSA